MSVEPLTTGTPVRAPRAPHAPRPTRTTPPRRRATRPGSVPSRARLSALPAPRAHAPRAPFVLLVVALLGLGLLALLLLNTASAQDAFRLSDLQRQSKTLADQEQALSRQAADLSDPASVAAAATKLGMVPGAVPIFLAPGQKVPAGEVIDGMVIVPGPRPTAPAKQSTPATQPTKPAQPTQSSQPATSASKPTTKSTTTKQPATTGLSAAQKKFLTDLKNFKQYADHIAGQSGTSTGPASAGSHP